MDLHQKSRDPTTMGPNPFCTSASDEREREGETLRMAVCRVQLGQVVCLGVCTWEGWWPRRKRGCLWASKTLSVLRAFSAPKGDWFSSRLPWSLTSSGGSNVEEKRGCGALTS